MTNAPLTPRRASGLSGLSGFSQGPGLVPASSLADGGEFRLALEGPSTKSFPTDGEPMPAPGALAAPGQARCGSSPSSSTAPGFSRGYEIATGVTVGSTARSRIRETHRRSDRPAHSHPERPARWASLSAISSRGPPPSS
jgi:hypothetical protein